MNEPRFRLERTPAGPKLYHYFAAILRSTGMEQGGVYPLKRFFSNLTQHEKAGRIQRVEGGHKLTQAGKDYFADRFRPGSPQHIEELDVKVMLKGLQQGGPGWIPLS